MSNGYSPRQVNDEVINEIENRLKNIEWGSIEIFIQNSKVTQIAERNIQKISNNSLSQSNNSENTKKGS